jgi:hypothetical protein
VVAFAIRCLTWALLFWGLFSHPAVVQQARAFHAGWVAAWTVEVAVCDGRTHGLLFRRKCDVEWE